MIFLPGVVLLTDPTFTDERGYFRETFRQNELDDLISPRVTFVQDNESCSRRGVVRGLHFQRPPHAQAKLVHAAHGRVWDVAVDLRPRSPTYGRWQGFELDAADGSRLYIPAGCAHGFMALTDDAVLAYKVSDYYAPECEGGVRWDDPTLNIAWPACGTAPAVSPKDAVLPYLRDLGAVFQGVPHD